MKTRPAPDPPRGFVAEWATTFVLLLFGTTTLAQAFVIPSGSMEGTLLVGDHVLVDRLAYAPADSASRHILPYEDLKRGDIFVFRYPLDIRKNYVKRAIGLPGDRIHLAGKIVYLNGHPISEPYAIHRRSFIDPYADNFPGTGNPPPGLRPEALAMLKADVRNGELVVPGGYIFALGDNRDESDDSRFWGLTPRANVVGKPLLIYWSYDAPTEQLSDPGLNAAHLIDVAFHFPTKTRWARTFRLVHGYPIQ
ncbi:MAG: signal peptidase I [Acidobacteriota bacterium]|nr:signal peptidase I [Acidobacteriota bacterium]